MRKLWVWAVLLTLGIGCLGVAGEITGQFTSLGSFGIDPFDLYAMESILEVNFSESGWTLGATAGFTEDGFDFIFFDAEGSLGAFDFYSVAGFDPFDWGPFSPLFDYWNSVVTVSIAGIDFYAITLLSNHWYYDATWDDFHDLPNEVGLGLRLGGWGTAGDITVYGELQFNVDSPYDEDLPYWIYEYGFEDFVRAFIGHVTYGDWYGWTDWYWADSEFTPYEPVCTLPWSGADFIVLTPFACFDLYVALGFTCDIGFDYLDLFVEHIDLGVPWFELAYVGIWFETDLKELYWAFDFSVGDVACIKPYFSLYTNGNSYSIDGVTLNALTLEYEVSPGVTFKAGELFTHDEWFDYVTWAEQWWVGWTASGEIAAWHDNLWEYGWDGRQLWGVEEYFALEIDGDACCGGQFDAFFYTWFDIDAIDLFMDWVLTVAGVRLGIATNTTLIFTMFVSPFDELNRLVLGSEFVW
jgi:hypothetical protein